MKQVQQLTPLVVYTRKPKAAHRPMGFSYPVGRGVPQEWVPAPAVDYPEARDWYSWRDLDNASK